MCSLTAIWYSPPVNERFDSRFLSMRAARLRQPPQSQRCYNLFNDPATRHRCRTVMKDLLKTALGKVFIHPVTRKGYGPIRLPSPPTDFARLDGSWYEACAEDSCGNNFTTTPDGAVFFWDHETDELIFLAGSISKWCQFGQIQAMQKRTVLRPRRMVGSRSRTIMASRRVKA